MRVIIKRTETEKYVIPAHINPLWNVFWFFLLLPIVLPMIDFAKTGLVGSMLSSDVTSVLAVAFIVFIILLVPVALLISFVGDVLNSKTINFADLKERGISYRHTYFWGPGIFNREHAMVKVIVESSKKHKFFMYPGDFDDWRDALVQDGVRVAKLG